MTYQQDLAKLHKERKARFYPMDRETMNAKAELASLQRQIEWARDEVERLMELRRQLAGQPSLNKLMDAVCVVHGITRDEIIGHARFNGFVRAREHFCHVAIRDFGATLSQLGRILDRDHTSIMHYRETWTKNAAYHGPKIEALDRFMFKDAEPMIG